MRENLIDTSKLSLVRLVNLTNEDLKMNENYNVRCTFNSYAIGEKFTDREGNVVVLDEIIENLFSYPYFNTITEAEMGLYGGDMNITFAMNAVPVREIGITGFITKEELINKLEKRGLAFNFMSDEIEKKEEKGRIFKRKRK